MDSLIRKIKQENHLLKFLRGSKISKNYHYSKKTTHNHNLTSPQYRLFLNLKIRLIFEHAQKIIYLKWRTIDIATLFEEINSWTYLLTCFNTPGLQYLINKHVIFHFLSQTTVVKQYINPSHVRQFRMPLFWQQFDFLSPRGARNGYFSKNIYNFVKIVISCKYLTLFGIKTDGVTFLTQNREKNVKNICICSYVEFLCEMFVLHIYWFFMVPNPSGYPICAIIHPGRRFWKNINVFKNFQNVRTILHNLKNP